MAALGSWLQDPFWLATPVPPGQPLGPKRLGLPGTEWKETRNRVALGPAVAECYILRVRTTAACQDQLWLCNDSSTGSQLPGARARLSWLEAHSQSPRKHGIRFYKIHTKKVIQYRMGDAKGLKKEN